MTLPETSCRDLSMYTPEQRKLPRQPEPVYGQWLRDPKNAAYLSSTEERELVLERAWETSNMREVAELDAMIGRTVRLVRGFRTYATNEHNEQLAELGSVPEKQKIPQPERYGAGRRLVVFARAGKVLLARMTGGVVLQVRREWVSV